MKYVKTLTSFMFLLALSGWSDGPEAIGGSLRHNAKFESDNVVKPQIEYGLDNCYGIGEEISCDYRLGKVGVGGAISTYLDFNISEQVYTYGITTNALRIRELFNVLNLGKDVGYTYASNNQNSFIIYNEDFTKLQLLSNGGEFGEAMLDFSITNGEFDHPVSNSINSNIFGLEMKIEDDVVFRISDDLVDVEGNLAVYGNAQLMGYMNGSEIYLNNLTSGEESMVISGGDFAEPYIDIKSIDGTYDLFTSITTQGVYIADYTQDESQTTTVGADGIWTSGTVEADKVITSTWKIPGGIPDYVFEKDYNLPALSDVESYIKKNKHLPEIPSAKEFLQKGVDLANMNMLLLKKVEELTLYSIKQEKVLTNQKTRLEKLEKFIADMKKSDQGDSNE